MLSYLKINKLVLENKTFPNFKSTYTVWISNPLFKIHKQVITPTNK